MKLLLPVARGMGLFLALFTLLNLLGDLFSPGFDSNHWWIDLSPLPEVVSDPLLLLTAGAMLGFALRPPERFVARLVVRVAVATLLLFTVVNTATFYLLLGRGSIRSSAPVPLSMFLALALGVILASTFAIESKAGHRKLHVGLLLVSFLGCAILFPFAQMYCFGKTDYRRQADAIVVLGCLAHADGTPSQPLEDRVNTAIELYHEGYAPLVIFTGGPTRGPLSEPDVMRKLALSKGVPDSAIILDPRGYHTDASVENTVALAREKDLHSFLVVSHFYHLPRIKMTYLRAVTVAGETKDQRGNLAIYTTPAREPRPLRALPRFLVREIVALYAYYLRPLVG